MSLFSDLLRRLRRSIAWVAAQSWAMLLILLAGIAWTRLPDERTWQVSLSLLLPLALIAAMLALQAGTMRSLMATGEGRVRFVWGAFTLVAWAALVCLGWWLLNWCDDQVPEWAGYLNSRASAGERATTFTYEHLRNWLTILIWIFRWIALPAKVIPHAMASAEWGWNLPWRKLFRLLLSWRWWAAAVLAALLGVALPGHFFTGGPHGTVAHQVWAVILKLGAAYLLAILAWVLLLSWCATLLNRPVRGAAQPGDDSEVPAPVAAGPLGVDSVKLPLPEGDNDAGGNV